MSFYDTIDHERLIQILWKYCRCKRDSKFENLLRECLSKWSAHTADVKMSRGIPQGSNASDFLANLFLYELDKIMICQGYNYVRYVDDIRILGLDKQTVQQGLILFDLELKRAGLVAQVTKTSIHEIEDINKEITHLRFIITDPTGTGEYTHAFPSESGLHDGYASLTDRKVFTASLPNGHETWKELGSMRNRVDHPVDKKTKSHSKKITIEETKFFCKKLNVALQEIFNFWLNSSPVPAPTTSVTVSTT